MNDATVAAAALGLLGLAGATWAIGPRLLRAVIRRRLSGYRIVVAAPDPTRPATFEGAEKPRVAVIGAGVAGLTVATTLAERGLDVTVLEAKNHVGGKLGSWPFTLRSGETAWVSHGFHAFFRHYYNLDRWLEGIGARRGYKPITDYTILEANGESVRFGALETTPILNLLAMSRAGIYNVADALHAPQSDVMGVFLEYDAHVTFRDYDHLSFADFDRVARLPAKLKLAFATFSRAFFADESKLSLAELIKCFHFYYLSHDHGLLYDYPTRDYEPTILAPARAHIEAHGGRIRLGAPVRALERRQEGFLVNGEVFDDVVVATDVVGARAIVTEAKGLPTELSSMFHGLRPGQRYAVWRIWIDRDARADLPVFVITDKVRVLDAVAFYHRLEDESAAWAARHGGAVLELHCYAVPDDLADEAELRSELTRELLRFFPELLGFAILDEHLQLERNFTAFHVGQWAARPGTDSGVPGLVFAGDWVKLDFPAMLLEAACASGLVAANRVLERHAVRGVQIDSVPLRGVLAGAPQPRGRRVLKELRVPGSTGATG